MALARVVTFDNVDGDRMAQLSREIEAGEPPAEIPATEMIMLHDAAASKAVAIIFFDSHEDYAKGDAALSAMPDSETPGTRTSITKYDVMMRMTA